jgi:hypothetical protein
VALLVLAGTLWMVGRWADRRPATPSQPLLSLSGSLRSRSRSNSR